MYAEIISEQEGVIAPEIPKPSAGFASGSVVLTLDGETLIDTLQPGDRVITRDTGMSVLRHIAVQKQSARAVRIAADTLGQTRPGVDVMLAADQPVLIRDWRAKALFGAVQAMVPAAALVDGEFICDLGAQDLTLYQLTFDAPHVIYVDGLEVGTVLVDHRGPDAA